MRTEAKSTVIQKRPIGTRRQTHINTRGVRLWEVENILFVHVWLGAITKCPEMRSGYSQVVPVGRSFAVSSIALLIVSL